MIACHLTILLQPLFTDAAQEDAELEPLPFPATVDNYYLLNGYLQTASWQDQVLDYVFTDIKLPV